MEWAVWIGAIVFATTIIGLFWMRNRPLRDARGDVVDEFGRPVARLSSDANVVLITLRNHDESLSGYDLRRHVTMSRQDFYAMIADLEHRDLITSEIVLAGTHNVRRYRLTAGGYALFRGDQNAA